MSSSPLHHPEPLSFARAAPPDLVPLFRRSFFSLFPWLTHFRSVTLLSFPSFSDFFHFLAISLTFAFPLFLSSDFGPLPYRSSAMSLSYNIFFSSSLTLGFFFLSHDLAPFFTSSPSPTLLSSRLPFFFSVFRFVLSRHRTPLFLYISLYPSFIRHFLFFLFPDRTSSIPFSSSSVFLLLLSYSFILSSPSLSLFCSIADPFRAPSFFRSLFISLFLSQSHFLSPSQYFSSLTLSLNFSLFLPSHLPISLSLSPSLSRLLTVFISFPLPFF